MNFRQLLTGIAAGTVLAAALPAAHADVTLLNVSYDPTRELYRLTEEKIGEAIRNEAMGSEDFVI